MAPRSPRRLARLLAAALAGLAVVAGPAACSQDAITADRAAHVYGAVLTWLLDQELPLPTSTGTGSDDAETALVTEPDERVAEKGGPSEGEELDPPLVYVVGLHREIGLQVQVELVARFDERGYDLRFLDSAEEALDEADPTVPVRNEALLVGLGPIPEGRRVDVRAEVYRSSADVDAYRFSLARWGGVWSLVAEPVPVEPEGFVAAP